MGCWMICRCSSTADAGQQAADAVGRADRNRAARKQISSPRCSEWVCSSCLQEVAADSHEQAGRVGTRAAGAVMQAQVLHVGPPHSLDCTDHSSLPCSHIAAAEGLQQSRGGLLSVLSEDVEQEALHSGRTFSAAGCICGASRCGSQSC